MEGPVAAPGADVTRRTLLAGAVVGAAAVAATGSSPAVAASSGAHQPGIATRQQAHGLFAAFDLRTAERDAVAALLRAWSARIAALTAAAPSSARLTITLGLGPGFFTAGLAAPRPRALATLPPFRTDRLDPAWSGGDLLLQICAERRAAADAALAALTADAVAVAAARWTQAGFVTPSRTGAPRNLLGFREGTANPEPGSAAFRAAVWADARDVAWMAGGTYLVLRRIRLALPAWRRLSAAGQQRAIGRDRDGGEPYEIPLDAHAWRAREAPVAAPMYRRPYNVRERGADGREETGLVFCAYVRDPASQFTPVQRRLAASDRLNAFATHVGSAVFAIPPAPAPGGWLGQGAFAAAA